jgi:hypothetical protein
MLLMVSGGLTAEAIMHALAYSGERYDIYVERSNQPWPVRVILVRSSGVVSLTEEHITLAQLMKIRVQRPAHLAWCGGATMTLFFENGDVVRLGPVNNVAAGIEALHAALPRRFHFGEIDESRALVLS